MEKWSMKRPSIKNEDIIPRKFFKKHRFLMRLSALVFFIVSPILFPVLICIEHKQDIKDLYEDVIQGIIYKK
jgi:hypothetical protein